MIAQVARHPTAANLLMLVAVLLGLLAAPDLQRESYPQFDPETIRISASYPGADAEIIDKTMVQMIEDAISGLDGVDSITSQSREGTASITVEVEDGAAVVDVLAAIKSAIDNLREWPEDIDPPVASATSRRAAVASVAVSGPMSAGDLKLYCEQMRLELLRDPQISQVSVAGFSTHRLLIQLEQAALIRYGLGLSDVSAAVAAQSLDTPIGTIERAGGDLLLRYSDERTTVTDLAAIVVKSPSTGGQVTVGDLGEVRDTFAIEEEQTQLNGERACTLGISKTAWQDSLTVLAAVEAFLADQERRKPPGVALTLTQNVAIAVQDQIDLLVMNAIQGLLLVFFTLWLFFHLRLAFWVAAGLPVSVLGALALMQLLGQTINMMTMMAMLIALGLVMDDAIVFADNFVAHRERGKSAMDAAVDAVKEVSGGIFSSFLTTACVFIPLASIGGSIGRVLQVIPVILVAVLAVSLVEAFLILPSHLGHSMRNVDPNNKGRFRSAFDRGFANVRERWLGGAVDFAVRWRWPALGLTIAVFIVSVGMVSSGRLRYVAFPAAEGNVAEFRLALPPGTPLARTQQEVDRVVAAAWKVNDALSPEQPEQQPLVRNVSVRFNYNPEVTDEAGPHLATVAVDLLDIEARTTTLDTFSRTWRDTTGPLATSATSKFTAATRGGPAGNPIEVEIQGDDLARVEEVSTRIQAWFAQYPGVFDLGDNLDPGSEQVRVRLREGAGTAGLTGAALAQQVRAALSGVSIKTFNAHGENYELFVEMERRSRDSLADLEYFPVAVSPGVTVPLGALARIDVLHGYARINRRDGARTVTVTGNLDAELANAAELMARFEAELAPEIEREYPELRLAVGGAAQQSAEVLGSMVSRLLIGLFGVYILLSLQFRSWVAPFVVMMAIPFAFVGVVWGHLLLGMPLSSQSIFGLIAIAGVVVNDSILLMVFLNAARVEGADHLTAARTASRDRFRAVLLTSATTIAGLFPILFETSRHAQTLIPVAASIVFGLAASTVLVLIIIPAIYAALSDLGLAPEPWSDPDKH